MHSYLLPVHINHNSQELATKVVDRVLEEEFVSFFLDVVTGPSADKSNKAVPKQEKGPKEIDPEVDEGFYAHHDLPRTPTGQESRSGGL